jgi:NADH dehydrogenase
MSSTENSTDVLVLGGGFAGLWAAAGAARRRHELKVLPEDAPITLINRDAFHSIRVRNYEADLKDVRVPLASILEPIQVRPLEGEITNVDLTGREVIFRNEHGDRRIAYRSLVFALGSQLVSPPENWQAPTFNVDTFRAAAKLDEHLNQLPNRDSAVARTVVVIGGGLTGIETAAEMPRRLRHIWNVNGATDSFRVVLLERGPCVAGSFGSDASEVIEHALADLGVEIKINCSVISSDASGVALSTGERIPTSTVIFCAGMRANPLTARFPGTRDRLGRIPVDSYLRVESIDRTFVAGDAAALSVDGTHQSVMSCQFSRPMGRFAGYNVMSDLLGQPMRALTIDWYVTVIDLGAWGALYLKGWNHVVALKGMAAKEVKQAINCRRIYPPQNQNPADILAAAEASVQAAP